MSITVTYPGVYVTEDASPSFSVGNAPTAVPVFVGTFLTADYEYNTSSACTRVISWLDFCSKFWSLAIIQVSVVLNSPGKYNCTITHTNNPAPAVNLYFQNGGGACYILNSGGDEMLAAIGCENDITILVDLEGNSRETLNPLLIGDGGYFMIAASYDGTDLPVTQPDQTAVYYPGFNTNYHELRPSDDQIYATYWNGAEVNIDTLADLKAVDPEAYAQASAYVDSYLLAHPVSFSSPVAAIAGIYCTTDATRGVWKAPANVVVKGVTGVQTLVTDDQQGDMNSKGINVIRYFPDRGVVVWGARTLAGASSNNNDTSWRYIPVRRLFNSAERDIKQALQLMVFEPNNEPTWEKVRSAIENYLHNLWRQGALVGTTTAEAYFVQIGLNVTMSEEQVAAGQMIATVGMAAVRPAEFIILQFTQNMSV